MKNQVINFHLYFYLTEQIQNLKYARHDKENKHMKFSEQ